MKILAFTDTHTSKTAIRFIENKINTHKPDILVCCGDFSIFGNGMDNFAKKLNSFNLKTIIIPGNHESPEEIEVLAKKYKNLISLHKKTFDFMDYQFVGFGTGGFSYVEPELERFTKYFVNTNKKLIFVTHAPIYKTKLDYLFGAHRGCKSSRKFIEKFKPVLALCGHFHESEGKKDKIRNCVIINPGKLGMLIKI